MKPSHYIHGNWHSGRGAVFDSKNPFNQDVLWSGASADSQQVNDAIVSSRSALTHWSTISIDERIAVIKRFAQYIKESEEVLAQLISKETGKPLWESQAEVQAMQNKIPLSIKAHNERTSTKITDTGTGQSVIRHKPHGVIAVFGPYNFPGHLPNGHIIPALLAGNTVVFKPSELTPATAELTVKLWHQSGLPKGVLNLLQGEKDTGIALASHPSIDGLYFTGSSDTGKRIHQQFGGRPAKILALEMGGNNPLIITELKNTKAAVHNTIQSAFITSGQRCTCARRLFVPSGAWGDQFLDDLLKATQQIVIGEWNSQPQPFMGTLISEQAVARILMAQKNLIALGGKPLLQAQTLPAGDALLRPGIIDVSGIKHLPDEEYFGPLLQVIRYVQLTEAITSANNTRFGLAAGLLSDEEADYTLFLANIRAGIVNWNRPLTGANSHAPFGGIGESGNHQPSAYYAADYCAYPVASIESKTLDLPEKQTPGLDLNY